MELAKRAEARRQLQRSYSLTALYPLPLPPRLWRSTPTSPRMIPPRPLYDLLAAADVAGTSSSAPRDEGPSRTAGADEARSKQQPAEGPTRSDYTAMVRTALAKFQDDAAADDDEATASASAVMEQAMTALMDLTDRKRKVKPTEMPYEFATRWPISIADNATLQAGAMRDPVILASGYLFELSVAALFDILSEFDMFRKRMLDTGGIKMLRDMLKMKDAAVITEAATAILALCADYESKLSAKVYNVPELLLKCHMFTDDILVLLDCLPRAPYVFKKICDHALQLVNIIMAEHASGLVTSKGIKLAISLIYDIIERDVGKMKVVKNMEDFCERLHQLSSNRMPMQTMFQVESTISTLSRVSSSYYARAKPGTQWKPSLFTWIA